MMSKKVKLWLKVIIGIIDIVKDDCEHGYEKEELEDIVDCIYKTKWMKSEAKKYKETDTGIKRER